jgi:hypothetical protein
MIYEKTQKELVFDNKMEALIAGYQKLKAENRLLVEQAKVAQNQLKIAHKEFVDLQNEYQRFRLAKFLVCECSDAEKEEKKQKIEELVRKIDTCLKLLKD